MTAHSTTVRSTAAALALSIGVLAAGASSALAGGFLRHDLVSDGDTSADHVDPNLVNPWGIAFNPTGPVWLSDNGSSVSTLYDGSGNIIPLVVAIPGGGVGAPAGAPTGIVYNGSSGFELTTGNPSRFIFATEDGAIDGWAPGVDRTHAVRMIDNSGIGAVYKGLALSAAGDGSRLYATDFHNGRIDVFDSKFASVTVAGGFSDPDLPAGYAPFGIQAIAGDIYVSYAVQDDARHDDVKGAGLGLLDVFTPDGHLIRRLISHGRLNAPWGIALAPAGFGQFGGRLLIGNFGDGRVHAYDLASGRLVGTVRNPDGAAVVIDGLWGLAFGNGFSAQPVDTLFFSAGPGGEAHGLYGRIDALPGPAGGE